MQKVFFLTMTQSWANRLRANAQKLMFFANEFETWLPGDDYTERRKQIRQALEHTRSELLEITEDGEHATSERVSEIYRNALNHTGMKWFGAPWSAPCCREMERAAVPVGSPCAICKVSIVGLDRGFMLPRVVDEPEKGTPVIVASAYTAGHLVRGVVTSGPEKDPHGRDRYIVEFDQDDQWSVPRDKIETLPVWEAMHRSCFRRTIEGD
jgi:hypothetical protein